MQRIRLALASFAASIFAVFSEPLHDSIYGAAHKFGLISYVDPTGTHRDGTMPFGAQDVTIATIVFKASNINVKRGTKRLISNDSSGVYYRKTLVKQLPEGSATLQLADSTTVAPAMGAAFTLVPIGGGSAVNYEVEDVSDKYDHEGETFVDITFSLKIN